MTRETSGEVGQVASRAYILIETTVGQTRAVADELRNLAAVESVDNVTGPFDIIAVVAGDDLNAVGNMVTDHIHSINGISHTVTCLSIGSV